MIVTIKGRVKSFEARMDSYVECDRQRRTVAHLWGDKGAYGTVKLTSQELRQLVAANAPYDPQARDTFFENLRTVADELAPPKS
jgi:hypothetical protein